MRVSILDFSPVADGVTLDTDCFQQAIDRIADSGGGTLLIDSGRYRLGGLTLVSNLCLHLEPGAELILSGDYADFASATTLSTAELSDRAFLYAYGKYNISITGSGKIIGSADAYFSQQADDQGYRLPAPQRPRVIVFEACHHVTLNDFTIEHAPMWTVHLVSCDNVAVNRLTIDNDLTMANTDALDIDSCQQVHISNCLLSAADDAVCIKTTHKPASLQRPAKNIVVTNCTLRSKSCALKIGTETYDDIEDVSVSNCTIFDSNRGIGLTCRDGGNFRRIQFSNIIFDCRTAHACHWGKADPVFISVRHRAPEIMPGVVEWIQFHNLSGVTEGAFNLHSQPPGHIRHVQFSQVQMQQLPSDSPEQGVYDIRPPCNPLRPTGMGLDNAYRVDPVTGRAFGVENYPGGLPVLFAQGVRELSIDRWMIERPEPLPENWNAQEQIIIS